MTTANAAITTTVRIAAVHQDARFIRPSNENSRFDTGGRTPFTSIAGAAVITLLRALLSLQVIRSDGSSFVLPQHWVNVFIGTILILAVLIDIWVRQANIFSRLRLRSRRPLGGTAHA